MREREGGLLRTVAVLLLFPALALAAQDIPEVVPSGHAASPQQRMQEAGERWRQVLERIRSGNAGAVEESAQALDDMEHSLRACAGAQAGCDFWQLLAVYGDLLRFQVDAAGTDVADDAVDETTDATVQEVGEDDDLLAAGAPPPEREALIAETPVPPGATAAELLRADNRQFLERVRMNPAVQAGIRRWLTDMRVSLITSHENFQYMQHLMSPAFRQHGLPEALLFGILAKESNGRVHARSRAGAAGPLQFMPATGLRFGLGVDADGFDTRYDPHKAADAAAQYLLERLAEVGNNIEYWLAAYNGGEGRARRVHAHSGGRSFWESEVYQQFPDETRDYVPMVIAAAWLYLHPDEYGLRFPAVDAQPATIILARSASIYELTICLGNGDTRDGFLRVLRNLNPGYRAETWIPAATELNVTVAMAGLYRQYCTEGARAELARQLIEADPQTARASAGRAGHAILLAPEARIHRVREGETLGAIARRHRCNLRALAAANHLRAPRYLLRIGQRLRLEGCTR